MEMKDQARFDELMKHAPDNDALRASLTKLWTTPPLEPMQRAFAQCASDDEARRIGSSGGALHNFVSDARSASLSGACFISSSKRTWSFITATGASLFSSAAMVCAYGCTLLGCPVVLAALKAAPRGLFMRARCPKHE